ncbi:hypothetical protein [Xanthobacter autotrophicus]|uniref:hypothetical protein n=1 Tax=Xanthobacter autotrophicus TaxID=280 RepID=UPI003729A8A8
MTDHTNTNPPGPLEAPSSPSPADAGGAVEVAVPPAGRGVTDHQRQILTAFTNVRAFGRPGDGNGEGWATAVWVAEMCDHHYDTPWASSKLPGLIKRGLVEKGQRGWYRITDAGRRLLKDGK